MKKQRKLKIKDIFKSRIFFFILGAIIFGIVGVGAASVLYSKDVTYDNTSSGLSSNNLQDALDELYEQASSCPVCDSEGNCTVTCPSDTFYETTSTGYKCRELTTAEQLVKKVGVITNGDGLYADSVESGRYIYRGSTVNNYITFNSETWRIMSVESDGTIKIIKDASLGNIAWDTAGNRSTTGYCNYSSYGCNSWGSTSTMTPSTMARTVGGTAYTLPSNESSLNTYLNGTYYNSLSSTAQSKIVSHTFNVGVVGSKTDTSAILTLVTREQANKWTGKIALMNITEFMRTTTSTSCTSLSAGFDSSSACSSNNWMFKSIIEWTLSPYSYSDSYYVWDVTSGGYIGHLTADYTRGVRPVVFLSSDITLSGSGTESDPYTIN